MTRETTWYRYEAAPRRLVLMLHVQPNAKKSGFAGLHGDALKVRIAAPATDNKANLALVEFLKESLGVPAIAIAIRHGATARRKVVEISGGPDLVTRVERLAAA